MLFRSCTKQEARDLLDRFSAKFSSISKYRTDVLISTLKKGTKLKEVPYVTTLFERRRYLPNMLSKDQYEKASAERQAFNTKIQGSAADIIKLAMIRAHAMLPEGSKLILTVHDELVTLAPDHLAEATLKLLEEQWRWIIF